MKSHLIVPAVLAAFAGPALSQNALGTSEFQVNTTTRGFPTHPAVAQSPSGGFVVVWNGEDEVDFPEPPFAFGVFGQRYDAAGRALGAEFQISRSVDYYYGPSTAIDAEGGLVVVWSGSLGVRASRFDAGGTALEEEMLLTMRGADPVVAGDAEGNWLVLWDPIRGVHQVMGRRFDAAAEVWDPEMAISEAADPAGQATLAGNERGDMVAAWHQGGAVVGRRLASSGEVRGATFQISESPAGNVEPAIDVDEQGGFVVVWRAETGILLRRFDASATPLGGEVLVSSQPGLEGAPVVALAGDEALVAWAHRVDVSLPPSRGPYQLSGRRYDGLGVPLGGEFPLTHLVATSPALAAGDPEGSVMLTFQADRELVGRLLPATLRTGVLQLADDRLAPFSEIAEERESRAVHVLRTGGTGPLAVEYFTADGALSRPQAPAASAGEDYAAAAGTLVFGDDEFVKSFPLEIFEDDVPDGNELLTVGLLRPTGGALLREPAAVEVVVYDDDAVGPGEGLAARGPELRVNGSRAGEQRYPRVAANAGGDFLVVWQGRDGDDWDVFARLYGADGAARGPELPLADATAGHQRRPAVAAAPDGSFVVSWTRQDRAVHGRRVTPSGGAAPSLGPELALGICGYLCTDLLETDVAVDGAGRFVVVWNGDSDIYQDYASPAPVVEGRRFSAQGEPLGDPFSSYARTDPAAVSAAASGEFVVIWNDYDSGRLVGRHWDAAGTPAETTFTVDAPGGSDPDVVRLPGAGFLVFWQGFEPAAEPYGSLVPSKTLDVYGRRFTALGAPLGERFLLNAFRPGVQSEPRAAAAPNGEHVVVWTSRDELGPGRSDVLLRRFAADGQRLGGRVPVNPSPRPKSSPDVAMDAAGHYVVVWESEVAAGDFDVFAQRFSGAACVAGQRALCLRQGRFRVEVTWRDFGGAQGRAFARPLTEDTGVFWFFNQDNLEVMVKVLDGRALNGHFWVFYGALSNVGFEIAVTDAVSGRRRTYVNPLGHFASAGDTQAFPGEG